MKKSAFTMLELIIVIVVVGIISVVMMPKTDSEPARDAANQLSRAIQYAQHLAMVDDVYDDTVPAWPGNRWGVLLSSGGKYKVQKGSGAVATDPLSKQPLNMDLETKFSVTSITITCGGNSVKGLAFDNLGRPYGFSGGWSGKTDQTEGRLDATGDDCVISLTGDGVNSHFTLYKETGYVGDIQL